MGDASLLHVKAPCGGNAWRFASKLFLLAQPPLLAKLSPISELGTAGVRDAVKRYIQQQVLDRRGKGRR
jgi:hypothetical protein